MTQANTKNWMSYLSDSMTLSKISIPGTHDSGTADLSAGLSHTQNFNIEQQLEDGIRYLDIRVRYEKGNPKSDPLQIYHNGDNCKISFGNVLNDCIGFLTQSPKETIIMLVNAAKEKERDAIQSYFNVYLENQNYKKLFYLNPVPSTLGDLRGKVVLFRRFPKVGPEEMGVDLSNNWKPGETFAFETPQHVRFWIEDEYTEHNTHKKWEVVKNIIDLAMIYTDESRFFITYNSIGGSASHTPYQYAWGGGAGKVDPKMNPKLESYLITLPVKKRIGIIVLDFYNNKEGSINNKNVIMTINSNEGIQVPWG